MSTNLFQFDQEGFPIFQKQNVSKFKKVNDNPKHVICLVGQARMGKSFFLNCFNRFRMKKNSKETSNIFASITGDEHCTKGVNVYENENFILIDCQGLKYEDSKGDDKLLLIAYTLSDIVIINGVKTLDNTMFSFIEPISVFENFLQKSKPKEFKPTLIFKIMDYQMDDEPDKKIMSQLKKLMTKTEDNYKTLRNTLDLIFSENIHAIYTMPPDRKEKVFLKKNDYKYALENECLHIRESIEEIYLISSNLNKKSKITHDDFIKKCIELDAEMKYLKENKSFNMDEADLSKLIGEKRCIEFCNKIINETIEDANGLKIPNPHRTVVDTFKTIQVSTTEREMFSDEITNIIKILYDFDEEFNKCDPNFVIPHLEKLCDHLFSSIVPKLSEMKTYITNKFESINVDHIVTAFINDYYTKIKSYSSHDTQYLNDFIKMKNQIISHYKFLMSKFIFFNYTFEKKNKIKYDEDDCCKIISSSHSYNIDIKTLNTGIKMKYESATKIKSMIDNFLKLCAFDSDVLFNKIDYQLDQLCEEYNRVLKENIISIGSTENKLKEIFKNNTSEEHISKFIISGDHMDPQQDIKINVIEKLKANTKSELMAQENTKLSIIGLNSIKVDFTNYKITRRFSPITPTTPTRRIKFFMNSIFWLFPQNLWQKYYDKLNDDIYTTKNIIEIYNHTIKQNINKMIRGQQINYTTSNIIISKNPSLRFIIFTQSTDFLHNKVRNHFVPTNGYLLLYDDIAEDQINNYKLYDIMKIYSDSQNQIDIKYINSLGSMRDLEMIKCQNSIIDWFSKYPKE